MPFDGESVFLADATQPSFGWRFDFHGFAAIRAYEMMVMPVITTQTEQLLAFQTHGISLACLSQGIQLTIYSGKADLHAFVFQLAMQILCGNEFIVCLQRIMNQFFLFGVALHASVRQSMSGFARRPPLRERLTRETCRHRFYFKSSQQPVRSRSATVCLVSSVSTVICPILRS